MLILMISVHLKFERKCRVRTRAVWQALAVHLDARTHGVDSRRHGVDREPPRESRDHEACVGEPHRLRGDGARPRIHTVCVENLDDIVLGDAQHHVGPWRVAQLGEQARGQAKGIRASTETPRSRST